MRSLFVWGFMGSGKSTAAPLAAAKLGLPFHDTDALLAAEHGWSVSDLFRAVGEPAFRTLEEQLVRRLLDGPPAVIALGGGSLLSRPLRLEVLRRARLAVLEVPLDVAAARVAGSGRPLADEAFGARLAERAEAYAECHAQVDGTEPPDRVAEVLARAAKAESVVVALGRRTYRVRVGRESALAEVVQGLSPSSVLGLTDTNLAPRLEGWFRSAAPGGVFHVTPSGEAAKDVGVLADLWRACLRGGLDRRSLIVALGGGVVTDLGCFAAGTWMRGIRWVSVPTSLLGMVDAGIGGKGAVDLDGVKNVVGVIHQPAAVVACVDRLATEPERSFRSGLAEVVKSALLGDAGLLDLLEADAPAILARDPELVARVVARAAQVKAEVVSVDERELGPRKLLNLGHTLGHALETAAGLGALFHGEAVAMGTVAALAAGVELGVTPPELVGRCEALLLALGLPTRPEPSLRERALGLLGTDKKREGERLTLALVSKAGEGSLRDVSLAEARRLFSA